MRVSTIANRGSYPKLAKLKSNKAKMCRTKSIIISRIENDKGKATRKSSSKRKIMGCETKP